MRWCLAAITWFCLTIALSACSTPKNNEKPILGNKVYQYKGWIDYCQRNTLDTDCKKAK